MTHCGTQTKPGMIQFSLFSVESSWEASLMCCWLHFNGLDDTGYISNKLYLTNDEIVKLKNGG